MRILLNSDNEDTALRQTLDVLAGGGVVAYPTETLYGLGALYNDEAALRRLNDLKHRPADKSFSLIIGSADQLGLLTSEVTPAARDLISRFWPGPLTLVFTALPSLSSLVTLNGTVAVRVPGESFALRLARSAGLPLTATSANISGRPPAADAGTLLTYFGDALDLIIDGGPAAGRISSTIADVTGPSPRLVRKGAIDISPNSRP